MKRRRRKRRRGGGGERGGGGGGGEQRGRVGGEKGERGEIIVKEFVYVYTSHGFKHQV